MFRYQSRIKFGLIGLAIAFIAACLKTIWTTFPIVEFYGILGVIYTGFVSGKTWGDIKEAKYANDTPETK